MPPFNARSARLSTLNIGVSGSAGSTVNDQFYSTGTPLGTQSGTRAYCSVQDAVLRLQPAGNITLVASYNACVALNPMGN